MTDTQRLIEGAGLAGEAGPMIGASAIALGIVLFVAFQRLGEWMLARRNAAVLTENGWTEAGRGTYALRIALQFAWLIACGWAALSLRAVHWELVALFLLLQLLKAWIILSLGPFWTGRILTHAQAPVLRRGPYRHLRHPGEWLAAAEIACLPLAFGAWEVALLFTLLNAALAWYRVRVEEAAIAGRPELR
jgi:methyltransferase